MRFENLLVNCFTIEKFTESILFDCFDERFVSPISKTRQTFKMAKSLENRTIMDKILLFLIKPLDKHGTTLVHITHPLLVKVKVQ